MTNGMWYPRWNSGTEKKTLGKNQGCMIKVGTSVNNKASVLVH